MMETSLLRSEYPFKFRFDCTEIAQLPISSGNRVRREKLMVHSGSQTRPL